MRRGKFVIAIDGPAGSGKSTIARLAAERLGLLYIDTGAMYRAFTWKALQEGVDLKNKGALIGLAAKTSLAYEPARIMIDGRDVTSLIRAPDVTKNISYIARTPEIRSWMVRLQRELAGKGAVPIPAGRAGRGRQGAVLEGRDIGTVVFPDADVKIYLDASIEERAGRRCKELKESGYSPEKSGIIREISRRDESDKTRKVAPLKLAKGAIIIDSTGMNIEETLSAVLKVIEG